MKKYFRIISAVLLTFVILAQSTTFTVVAASNPYIISQKWNKRTLYYYFDKTSSVNKIPDSKYQDWNAEVPACFDYWNSWLNVYNINLKFVKTNTKSKADIIIKYGTGPSWANVTWVKTSTTITKATITLDDFDFYTLGFTDQFINSIVKHEIGHTLGLLDVSVDKAVSLKVTSIMVNDLTSSRHSSYPTYDFDKVNLLVNYK